MEGWSGINVHWSDSRSLMVDENSGCLVRDPQSMVECCDKQGRQSVKVDSSQQMFIGMQPESEQQFPHVKLLTSYNIGVPDVPGVP
jgi:hypothetical protein